jgi:hypothetical protein
VNAGHFTNVAQASGALVELGTRWNEIQAILFAHPSITKVCFVACGAEFDLALAARKVLESCLRLHTFVVQGASPASLKHFFTEAVSSQQTLAPFRPQWLRIHKSKLSDSVVSNLAVFLAGAPLQGLDVRGSQHL